MSGTLGVGRVMGMFSQGLTLEDQMSRLKKLSKEDRSMTAITTICPSVTSMVPKVRVPDT